MNARPGQRRAPGADLTALFQDPEPPLERLAEAHFFLLGDACDEIAPFAKLFVVLAHEPDHLERDLVQKGALDAEAVAVANGAPHDPAQHVFGAGPIGQNAVGDQERRRAGVVGDHPHRDVVFGPAPLVTLARDRFRLGNERAKKIAVVSRAVPLERW